MMSFKMAKKIPLSLFSSLTKDNDNFWMKFLDFLILTLIRKNSAKIIWLWLWHRNLIHSRNFPYLIFFVTLQTVSFTKRQLFKFLWRVKLNILFPNLRSFIAYSSSSISIIVDYLELCCSGAFFIAVCNYPLYWLTPS